MNSIISTDTTNLLLSDKIDALEDELLKHEQVVCPIVNRFTPGLYSREIHMPKDALIISETHQTDHMYVISKGVISVWIDGIETIYQAPYSGITKAGTRRTLFIHENTIFTTFHPTNIKPKSDGEKDIAIAVEKIGRKILKENPNWDKTGKGMGNMELKFKNGGGKANLAVVK